MKIASDPHSAADHDIRVRTRSLHPIAQGMVGKMLQRHQDHPSRTFLNRSFFQFLNLIAQFGSFLEFFPFDRKQQFLLQPVNFPLALDRSARIAMDSLEQRVQPIREVAVARAAAKPSQLAELSVRQPALVASQIFPIRLNGLR
jgi:hypothetical protein